VSRARLEVRLPAGGIGALHRSAEGQTRWTPNPEWLAKGQSPRLGLGFLRDPAPRASGTGLPAWFENLLPEANSALRSRLARMNGLRSTDSFKLLAALGGDLPGAITVHGGAPEDPPEDDEPAAAEAPAPERRLRFSLAGMQIKLSMAAAGERLAVPARDELGAWIVKLPGQGYEELPRVEHATMAWAAAAGHPVPNTRVVPICALDGVPGDWAARAGEAFAIARFDRRGDGTRVHHEDLCQALEILPIHKYGDTGDRRIGYDGVLAQVVDACGEAEGRQLARRIGFVIASGNDDAHLKNWSLCWGSAQRPTLSPMYDHVATIAWPQHGWAAKGGPTLGLSIGRTRRFGALTQDVLARFNERSRQPWAADELQRGIVEAAEAWDRVGALAPASMRAALEAHWQRVPILRGHTAPRFT
jgi:serine/threonine-protein kinase HipA